MKVKQQDKKNGRDTEQLAKANDVTVGAYS